MFGTPAGTLNFIRNKIGVAWSRVWFVLSAQNFDDQSGVVAIISVLRAYLIITTF
jgi:hypothetical protein